MRPRLRGLVAVALVATALAGCRGPAEPGKVVEHTESRKLVVKVTGARTVSFSGRAEMHFVTREGKREQAAFSVAAVEINNAIHAPDGAEVFPEIGIVGIYTGDGAYTLPAGIGMVKPTTASTTPAADPQSGSVALSNVSVVFITAPGTPEAKEDRFGYLLQPCRIRLDDDAREGRAQCDALLAVDGRRIALDMTWTP